MTLYPKLLNGLIKKCEEYRSRKINVRDFHHTISQAEQEVTALEEKDLRQFFMLMESEIDYIRVMRNESDLTYLTPTEEVDSFEEIIPLIKKIEEECIKRLQIKS